MTWLSTSCSRVVSPLVPFVFQYGRIPIFLQINPTLLLTPSWKCRFWEIKTSWFSGQTDSFLFSSTIESRNSWFSFPRYPSCLEALAFVRYLNGWVFLRLTVLQDHRPPLHWVAQFEGGFKKLDVDIIGIWESDEDTNHEHDGLNDDIFIWHNIGALMILGIIKNDMLIAITMIR